jgi:hypothetical protein
MTTSAVASSQSRFRPLTLGISPWLGLVLLWLLFELPTTVKPANWEPGAMRPTLDVLALLTLWGASYLLPRGARALRIVLVVWAVLLFAFRLDQMIFRLLMRDDPLLYDQWFMVQHMIVLIRDLMNPSTALMVAGFLVGIALLVWLARAILRHAQKRLLTERRRAALRVTAVVWLLALVAAVASASTHTKLVRYATPELVGNVGESLAIYRAIQHGSRASPYAKYRALTLSKKPDVLLFIVESYGRILNVHEGMRDRHGLLLERLQTKLGEAGWHMASAYSRAPVSGGRSWLAEGSILMGTPIQYEAVFQHLVAERVPNFVQFLQHNGYEAALLAPADRERPGVRMENRYGYEHLLAFTDMNYRGPAMGWGLIPDQFSLEVARRKVLERRPGARPLFFNFHMVTSHAPWAAVPPLVQDTALLENLKAKFPTVDDTVEGRAAVMRRLRRFQRDDGVHPYMNQFTEPMRRGYQATISYDLQVIARYLESRDQDALVVILGDHQPPVITSANASFDTPVHVLSRDKGRLAEFVRQGFTPGLALADDAKSKSAHAGLFSLLVRALARGSDIPEGALPRFLPEGQPLFDAR